MQEARYKSTGSGVGPSPDRSDSDRSGSHRAEAPGAQSPTAPSRDTSILTEGSRFGNYVVGTNIGHGGMARIYRAEHEGLQRHVALKVLSPSLARDSEGRERFVREARIAAAIKHPNVVNIYDVGVHDGLPFLVMELLEGEDLEALLRRRGALSETAIVDILIPIVGGLVAVHDAGVVHRDLKPGNVFLARGKDESLEPQLLDFGISRSMNAEDFRLTLANGLLMGTPMYMSPEAIRGEDVTPLSDQYSLGVLLYECATGINPFSADSLADTMRRVTSGQFAPPTDHNPRLSPRLARLILRSMRLEPAERFPDMRTLGRELLLLAGRRTRITWSLSFGDAALVVGDRANAMATAVPESLAETSARPRRSRWRLAAAAAFGLITLSSLGGMAWVRSSASRTPADAHSSEAPVTGTVSTKTRALEPAPREPSGEPSLESESAGRGERDEPELPGATPLHRASDAEQGDPASIRRAPAMSPPRRRAAPKARPSPRSQTARASLREPARQAERVGGDDSPEWLISPSETPSVDSRRPEPRSLGTNNAPILD